MPQKLGYVALVVREYDEAIAFYTNKLEFQLIEDTDLEQWQTVGATSPAGLNRNRPAARPRSDP